MKRSLAPSVLSSSKKRFVTPFLKAPDSSTSAAGTYASSVVPHPNASMHGNSTTRENSEQTCLQSDASVSVATDQDDHKYYSVMWCKLSKKKHKSWESDAILLVKSSSAILHDMEGKSIAKGMGYRERELSCLTEGCTLIVGGKEVEIMSEISSQDWKSGKCFIGSMMEADQETVPVRKLALNTSRTAKPFTNPSKMSGRHGGTTTQALCLPPLHNSTAVDALVMPRPTPQHQLQYNPSGLGVVDVVVDPHLSTHLRPHQREGVTFLYKCVMGMKEFRGSGAILADEMGLGKTLQCISMIWTLLKQGPYGRKPVVKRVIVITPGSLVKNWEREFTKWLGPERLRAFSCSSENRVEEFVKSPIYPVLLISYEMFLRSQESLRKVPFDLVVCDEGHRLKNSSGKTASLIMGLPTRRRVILTGTPIQNDLQEFYSIVEFCNPGLLGTAASFRRIYEEPILQSHLPTASAEEKEIGDLRAQELNRLISLFCLRRTQEINNQYLPPKVENVVFCQMAPLQLKIYEQVLGSRLVQSCLRGHGDFAPHLLCIGALKKLCNSPRLVHSDAWKAEKGASLQVDDCEPDQTNTGLFSGVLPLYPSGYDNAGSVTPNDSGKLLVLSEMLGQILSATSEKVVVVSNYTKTLDMLQALCGCDDYKFLRLDGSTPSTRRQQIVERFNDIHGMERVFLLSSKAGGVGLNLIGASRLILYDIDWNPANDQQAMARLWRDGQRRKVHIYRLLCTGSIEEKIFQRQISKQSLSVVVDGGHQSVEGKSHFSLEELKDLFTLQSGTSCDTHDLLGCTCFQDDPCESSTSILSTSPPRAKDLNEIMTWKHYCSPLDDSELSDDLLQTASNVTCVFQKEYNS